MHILTNIHKMCIVKVKASNISDNRRTLATMVKVAADQNILLNNPQQYILYQHSHSASASASVSHR